MSVDPIQNLSEISQLVHAAKHDHDDHAEYHKKKRKKKHGQEHEKPDGDVEDLMDHSHEDADQPGELTVLPDDNEENKGQGNLDVLI